MLTTVTMVISILYSDGRPQWTTVYSGFHSIAECREASHDLITANRNLKVSRIIVNCLPAPDRRA